MRALLVLPAALVLCAAADPCTLDYLPRAQLPRPGESWYQLQRLNQQLNLAACVAQRTPDAMRFGSPTRIRAQVRAYCVGYAIASGTMTRAQADALSDRLVDQQVVQLTRCLYAPIPPIPSEEKGFPLNAGGLPPM